MLRAYPGVYDVEKLKDVLCYLQGMSNYILYYDDVGLGVPYPLWI